MNNTHPFPVRPPRISENGKNLRFTEDRVNDLDITSLLHDLWAYRKDYDHAYIRALWAELRIAVNVAALSVHEAKERGDIPGPLHSEP